MRGWKIFESEKTKNPRVKKRTDQQLFPPPWDKIKRGQKRCAQGGDQSGGNPKPTGFLGDLWNNGEPSVLFTK